MTKYTVLDLFCGAGAFSEGFRQEGFDIVLGVDFNKDCCATFQHNHRESLVWNHDLASNERHMLTEALNMCGIEIDVVIGGPPCQGFSTARPIGKEERESDPRNQLVYRFIDVIKDLKPRPRIILMENVPGILSTRKGSVVREIYDRLEALGYVVRHKVLNSANYGAPQLRKRVFFIGRNDGIVPHFPQPTHIKTKDPTQRALFPITNGLMPYVTVGDVLLNRDLSDLPNHTFVKHCESLVKRMEKQKPGTRLYSKFRSINIRLYADKPSFTVTCAHSNLFTHPTEPRCLTPRELAILQGIPDDFEILGKTILTQTTQIGNMVPVPLARALARMIREQLDEIYENEEGI